MGALTPLPRTPSCPPAPLLAERPYKKLVSPATANGSHKPDRSVIVTRQLPALPGRLHRSSRGTPAARAPSMQQGLPEHQGGSGSWAGLSSCLGIQLQAQDSWLDVELSFQASAVAAASQPPWLGAPRMEGAAWGTAPVAPHCGAHHGARNLSLAIPLLFRGTLHKLFPGKWFGFKYWAFSTETLFPESCYEVFSLNHLRPRVSRNCVKKLSVCSCRWRVGLIHPNPIITTQWANTAMSSPVSCLH